MGDETAENAAWSYEQPLPPVSSITNLVAFYRDKVDAIDEDELGG